jgi:MFS family permease
MVVAELPSGATMTSSSPITNPGRARLLAGAALGLVGGFTTTFFATSSQFIRPITEEFGWGRTELSLVIVLAMFGSALAAAPAGRLVARFGPRPVVAASGVFLALGLGALSMAPGSPTYFAVLALAVGVLSIGTTPVALLVAVPRFFDRKLGLALGVVMGGSAVGAGILQVVVGGVLEQRGWRSAYLLLAAVAVVLLALTALIGFPAGTGPEPAETAERTQAELPGLTVREALREWPFRVMLAALMLASIGPAGLTLHFVAFVTDRGIDPVAAAGAAAAGGFGVALGRLVSGVLLDRVNAVRLTGVILAVAALGFVVPALHTNASVAVYAVSGLIGGFAFGAEGDILPFLVRRYAGVRHFSRVLGVSLGVYGLGGVIGPLLFGLSFDRLGTYVPALLGAAAAMIVAALALQAMGPYRYPRDLGTSEPRTDHADPTAASAPAV